MKRKSNENINNEYSSRNAKLENVNAILTDQEAKWLS